MSLQAPLAQIPSLSAIGSDLWPSMSSALSQPISRFRRLRLAKSSPSTELAGDHSDTSATSNGRIEVRNPFGKTSSHITLPECLKNVSTQELRTETIRHNTSFPSLLHKRHALSQTCLQPHTVAGLRKALADLTPVSRNIHTVSRPRLTLSDPFRPLTCFAFGLSRPPRSAILGITKRSFSTTFQLANQSQLAHAERTANNNPTSATAQTAFYNALSRANMPKIIIERYQTGRYATNPASDAIYLKALQQTGSVPAPGSSQAPNMMSSGGALGQRQLQAVAQAVAGQNYDGQVIRPGSQTGTGAKEAPLYVVVEESWGATVLKWAKLFLWAGIVGYFLLVVLTMVVEVSGSFRTRTGQSNEVQPQHQTVRFSDVHGAEEAKDELQELVEFLKNPERFNKLGGKLPKGVLLVGPPGTGKTMLARAVAGEAGVPVFYMSGSEFDELYVGVGAKRVRDLFQQARNKSPSIIFIDELDAVGGKRNARDPAYAKQTLNQLLTELDGFQPSTGVILIAATNYPESLDKALTRPGRFDRHINVPLPDVRGRIEILKHHMKSVPIAGDVDATSIARSTSGMSGADLENLVNQAAVHASRMKQKKVTSDNFEWAKDKIMMGAEMKSRVIRDKDKIMTAYHEAGHALVNLFTPESLDLYKMTIIPRGRALGVTHFLQEMDAVSQGYDQYLAQIDVSMGGRAAEELVYGPNKVSSGISSDVSQATRIAYTLVTQFGYSPKLGNVDLATDYKDLSSETKAEIEREVRDLVEAGRQRADRIIKDKRKELEALKDALMEFETLDREEINKILKGEKLQRLQPEYRDDKDDDDKSGPKGGKGQEKKPKETSTPGPVGIKLPDVLLPPGAGQRGSNESA